MPEPRKNEILFRATGRVESLRIMGEDERTPVSAMVTLAVDTLVPGNPLRYRATFISATQLAEIVAMNGRTPLEGTAMTLCGIPVPSKASGNWVDILRAELRPAPDHAR